MCDMNGFQRNNDDGEPRLGPSKRSGTVPSFKAMTMLTKAWELEAQGRTIMHLEMGQPKTGAPSKVIEASRKMLNDEVLGYTPAAGVLALRERIAQHYKEKYDVEVQANRVVITTGSSGGFPLIFLSQFDVGDRVAVASSSYPCYRHVLNALGCEVMTIPTDDQYKVTAGAVARFVDSLKEEQKGADANNKQQGKLDRPLKGLILSSPSNPTGTMLSPEEIEDMVKVCEERGIAFISDEIYHGICYDKVAQTALAYSDQCYAINSFSKFYSMTGWRLGWMVVPEHMVETIKCLAMNFFISAPTLSQLSAAVAAFECEDELMKHVKMYKTNREILWRGLSSIGFTNIAPSDGGFYMYVDVSELVEDSTVLAADMLEEAGVAVTPGVDFEDPSTDLGLRHVRFSFCGSTDDINEAVIRLRHWWGGYAKRKQLAV